MTDLENDKDRRKRRIRNKRKHDKRRDNPRKPKPLIKSRPRHNKWAEDVDEEESFNETKREEDDDEMDNE